MNKNEADLYQELKSFAPKFHWRRIENGVMAGDPDVNVAGECREKWLELKIIKKGRIEIRHSQLNWFLHRCHYAKMHNVFVVAKDGDLLWIWEAREIWRQAQAAKADAKTWRARVDGDSMTFAPEWDSAIVAGRLCADSFSEFLRQ